MEKKMPDAVYDCQHFKTCKHLGDCLKYFISLRRLCFRKNLRVPIHMTSFCEVNRIDIQLEEQYVKKQLKEFVIC